MTVTFGSLFSGIGGFDLAFTNMGMECKWQVEWDKSCQSVLARHWPDVPRFGDIRSVGNGELEPVDVLCGGFPCQDLSVAGKRAGLAGERSGLWHEFARIIGELAPRWVVVENVPGLLSSNGGGDFATVLRALVELGYGVAWRVLDAQYFGVAQRRRRVFIVGHLGDGRAAEVLFESEGVCWYSPPSREKRPRLATDVAASIKGGSGQRGFPIDCEAGLVANTLDSGEWRGPNRNQVGTMVSFPLTTSQQRLDTTEETMIITHPLTARHDSSEDGCGRGTPLIVQMANSNSWGDLAQEAETVRTLDERGGRQAVAFTQNQRDEVRDLGDCAGSIAAESGSHQQNYVVVRTDSTGANGCGVLDDGTTHTLGGATDVVAFQSNRDSLDASSEVVPTLRVGTGLDIPPPPAVVYPINTMAATRPESAEENRQTFGVGEDGDPMFTLQEAHQHAVAVQVDGDDQAATLRGFGHGWQGQHNTTNAVVTTCDVVGSMQANAGTERKHGNGGISGWQIYMAGYIQPQSMGVRRLTPTECERLQGFPNGFTDGQADSTRYRQLGNAVCVPVVEWIGRRIVAVEKGEQP